MLCVVPVFVGAAAEAAILRLLAGPSRQNVLRRSSHKNALPKRARVDPSHHDAYWQALLLSAQCGVRIGVYRASCGRRTRCKRNDQHDHADEGVDHRIRRRLSESSGCIQRLAARAISAPSSIPANAKVTPLPSWCARAHTGAGTENQKPCAC
jgi:hypothetical protein